jgi:hypothetical protein
MGLHRNLAKTGNGGKGAGPAGRQGGQHTRGGWLVGFTQVTQVTQLNVQRSPAYKKAAPNSKTYHSSMRRRFFEVARSNCTRTVPVSPIRRFATTTALIPFTLPSSLKLNVSSTAGRLLVASTNFSAGDILLEEAPLIAVGPPHRTSESGEQPYCSSCFRAVPSTPMFTCTDCSALYCSPECRQKDLARGHDLVCGALSTPLDTWCSDYGRNFPRVAARLLAKSLSEGQDFAGLWGAVNALVSVSVPADEDMLPGEWRIPYELLRESFRPRMGGAVDSFFSVAFNVRAYARLMGTLRLNSFTLQCPLPAQSQGGADTAVERAQNGARAVIELPTRHSATASAQPAPAPQEATACASRPSLDAATAAAAGCCGDGSPLSGGGGCGSGLPPADSAPPDRGTALYGAASLVNHACDPNLDVVIGPEARIYLRARRTIAAGEDLSIAYLDCSAPVAERRMRLQHSYGFTCECRLCLQQLAEAATAAKQSR